MKRSSGLNRSAALVRSQRRRRQQRARTSPEERRARAVVTERSGGVCEGCSAARATDWSHRVAEGQGGPYCPSNGMHLCRACHAWLHANPTAARDERGWRLLSTDEPAEVPVLHAVHGWVLLTDDGCFVPTDRRPS